MNRTIVVLAVLSLTCVLPITVTAKDFKPLPRGVPFQTIDTRLDGIEVAVEDIATRLEKLLDCVRVIDGNLGGLPGPHVVFSKCNVHIRSGGLATDAPVNGSGNLILGYNEGTCFDLDTPGVPTDNPDDTSGLFLTPCLSDDECGEGFCQFDKRDGSHNLVVGHQHKYPSYGGILGGRANTVEGPQSSVTGGYLNAALDSFSAVHGGAGNSAEALGATVVGGLRNSAEGPRSVVLAGSLNAALGDSSAVVSGHDNVARGNRSVVVSGGLNEASGRAAVVVGGGGFMLGQPVSGSNDATGDYSAILGGQLNITGTAVFEGHAGAVCGGINNNASGIGAVVGGGNANRAIGDLSSVSGGLNRSAVNQWNWAAGGQSESQ